MNRKYEKLLSNEEDSLNSNLLGENMLLSPREVGVILQVKESTLESWRIKGIGPKFVKLTSRVIRYQLSDLKMFLQKRVVSNSCEVV